MRAMPTEAHTARVSDHVGRVAALLLAAGDSSRMGHPKPLLPWLETVLVAYQVKQILLAGARPVIVVLGAHHDRVAAALADLPETVLAMNPNYHAGKTTSIRLGVERLPADLDAVLLHAVDQPRRADTRGRLIDAHREGHHLITIPTYQDRRGHPPILAASLLPELASLSEERQGLRELMLRHHQRIAEVPVETPEVLLNLNTPEDYRGALAYFNEGGRKGKEGEGSEGKEGWEG